VLIAAVDQAAPRHSLERPITLNGVGINLPRTRKYWTLSTDPSGLAQIQVLLSDCPEDRLLILVTAPGYRDAYLPNVALFSSPGFEHEELVSLQRIP
jgi:hypothetical protein